MEVESNSTPLLYPRISTSRCKFGSVCADSLIALVLFLRSTLECNYSYRYICVKRGLFTDKYILYIYIRQKDIFTDLFQDLINWFSNSSFRA